jgi:hypothetical protein
MSGSRAKAKRPCIEVDTGNSGLTSDPINHFAYMLRLKHNSTEEVEEYNRRLLETLIGKGHIPKSNIIWRDEKLARIYGFKIDDEGKIEYDTTTKSSPKSSPKKVTKAYAASIPEVDLSMLKDAVIRANQMAI